MRDAHGGIRRVDRLAAGARGTEGGNAEIFGFDLNVHVFGFRKHSDGDRGGMDASLSLGGGHALHAVDAALVLQLGVGASAFDDGDDFFEPADSGFGGGEHFDLPAL